MGYWLQMIGPNASPIPAQMIQFKSLGNGSDKVFIQNAMYMSVFMPDINVRISGRGVRTVPLPTAVINFYHMKHGSFNRGSIGINS
mgnify:CR=1 FL=1